MDRDPFEGPPFDRDAEQSVLGSVILQPTVLPDVREVIDADDFYVERHQHIYRGMVSLADRGEPPDIVTLAAALREVGRLDHAGGLDYISELMKIVPSAANVMHYVGIVSDRSKRRRLRDACMRGAVAASNLGLPADDIMAGVEKDVMGVGDEGSRGIIELLDSGRELWDDLDEVIKDPRATRGVATGFDSLDAKIHRLAPGRVYVLAARPGVGKTTFMLNLAYNAARSNKSGLIFSLEMSHLELTAKLLGLAGNVNASLFDDPEKLAESGALPGIARALDRLKTMPLAFDDTPGIDMVTMASRARRRKSQAGLDVVFVDYLQLMGGPGREEYDRVSHNSQEMKKLAKQLHIPIVLLSQLSREAERRSDHKPILADLRSSGSVEQDADVVMFLYRPGMYQHDLDRYQTQIILAKQRHGESNIEVPVYFDAEHGRFIETQYRAPV